MIFDHVDDHLKYDDAQSSRIQIHFLDFGGSFTKLLIMVIVATFVSTVGVKYGVEGKYLPQITCYCAFICILLILHAGCVLIEHPQIWTCVYQTYDPVLLARKLC